jgi:type I restriction enzyme M protein
MMMGLLEQSKLRPPAVDLIDKETWVSMSAGVKGDACKGLLDATHAHPSTRGIPTSCLSKSAQDTKSGADEAIRRKLLHECDVHTLLRPPTSLFYAQGVKANVLFFDKKPASETPWTKKLWIYDLRTNTHFTFKTNPLKREDLDDFVQCYNPANQHQRKPIWSEKKPDGRWRAYGYDELAMRDKVNLDIFWLKDQSLTASDNLPSPDVLAQEIVEDLEAALEQFRLMADDLESTSRMTPSG